jgi:tetratricopeptide (TPR) repeat protein
MNGVSGLVVGIRGPVARSWVKSCRRRVNLPQTALSLALAAALVLPFPLLAAQQASQQPAPQQPAGVGTQLQTGTSSGLEADERLRNLLADHQYKRLAAELDKLPADEARFYRGILANRSNDLKQSIEMLEPLADRVASSGDTEHEKLLRKALAEDYLRLGDWAKAAQAYQKLDERLHAKLSADERDEIEMPLKMLPLAKDNPPISVEACDPFVLPVSTNPLDLIDVPVFVDARSRTWMLDPTAPFNLIARSTAREVGLKISEETATIRTLTGRPIQVHSTVIPRFTLGGQLTFRNVTAFVYDDADYYFRRTGYQVEGVLGLPALMGFGSLTVSSNSTIAIHPAKQLDPHAKDDRLSSGAPFYLDGDQVIVTLGRVRGPDDAAPQEANEDERNFVIDAGGQLSYLTSRYYEEHAAEFIGLQSETYSPPGQPSAPQLAYVAETVPLAIGSTAINLHYLRVLTQPLDAAALEDVYGVLGVDALGQLKSYTFDYRTMRFTARAE